MRTTVLENERHQPEVASGRLTRSLSTGCQPGASDISPYVPELCETETNDRDIRTGDGDNTLLTMTCEDEEACEAAEVESSLMSDASRASSQIPRSFPMQRTAEG